MSFSSEASIAKRRREENAESVFSLSQVYFRVHADLRAKLSLQMSKPHLCSLAQPATSKFASAVEFGEKSAKVLRFFARVL